MMGRNWCIQVRELGPFAVTSSLPRSEEWRTRMMLSIPFSSAVYALVEQVLYACGGERSIIMVNERLSEPQTSRNILSSYRLQLMSPHSVQGHLDVLDENPYNIWVPG